MLGVVECWFSLGSNNRSEKSVSEVPEDNFQNERNVDISHEAVGIGFNAAKLIRSESKDFARLERKRLKETGDALQIESDEECNLNITYGAALKRSTNN